MSPARGDLYTILYFRFYSTDYTHSPTSDRPKTTSTDRRDRLLTPERFIDGSAPDDCSRLFSALPHLHSYPGRVRKKFSHETKKTKEKTPAKKAKTAESALALGVSLVNSTRWLTTRHNCQQYGRHFFVFATIRRDRRSSRHKHSFISVSVEDQRLLSHFDSVISRSVKKKKLSN